MSEAQQVDNNCPQAGLESSKGQMVVEDTNHEDASCANKSAPTTDERAADECPLPPVKKETTEQEENSKESLGGEPIALPQADEVPKVESDQEESGNTQSEDKGGEEANTEEFQKTSTSKFIDTMEGSEKEDNADELNEKSKKSSVVTEGPNEKNSSVGTSTSPPVETQEVSSTKNDEPPSSRQMRTSRRPSHNASRSYASGYQNYGLAYLPYKSNFEPSEDARRKADEFFKTLKL